MQSERTTDRPPSQARRDAPVHLVILIPGFLTRSENQYKVKDLIENEVANTKVVVASYGYFDLLRFLLPGKLGKNSSIDRVKKKMSNAIAKTHHSKVSVIAHSFGSFILGRILEDDDNVKFENVILCGGIFNKDFNWERFLGRIGLIVNDCGVHDPWPVLAVSTGGGFGSTGRFGVGGLVNDRFHDFGHSGFWEPSFVREFWIPIIRNSELQKGRAELTPSPWWVNIPEFINIWYLGLGLLVAVLGVWWLWSASNACGLYDCPDTNTQNARHIGTIVVEGRRLIAERVSEEHRVTEYFRGRNETKSASMSPGDGWKWDLSLAPKHEQGAGEKGRCVPPSFSGATEESIKLSAHLERVWDFPEYEDAHQECTLIAIRYKVVETSADFRLGPFDFNSKADVEIRLPPDAISYSATLRMDDGKVIPFSGPRFRSASFSAEQVSNVIIVSPLSKVKGDGGN